MLHFWKNGVLPARTRSCPVLTGLMICFAGLGSAGGQDPRPCTKAVEKLTFLEGAWRWTLRDLPTGADAEAKVKRGHASWGLEAGGCVLLGRLQADGHEELRLISYDGRSREWQLAVVDSGHGNLFTMQGSELGAGLRFISPHLRRGRLLIDRLTVSPTTSGSIEWVVETSHDAGATWTRLAEESFTRRGEEQP